LAGPKLLAAMQVLRQKLSVVLLEEFEGDLHLLLEIRPTHYFHQAGAVLAILINSKQIKNLS
jgi:hypothetical protein